MKRTSTLHRRTRCDRQSRNGAALVEFALTLPILLVFVFASIEFAYVNMVQNTSENAAYEAARVAGIPGGTKNQAIAKARTLMNSIGAKNVTITVTPEEILNSTPQVTVQISVPMDSNGYVSAGFFKNRTITRSCTLDRERVTPQ